MGLGWHPAVVFTPSTARDEKMRAGAGISYIHNIIGFSNGNSCEVFVKASGDGDP